MVFSLLITESCCPIIIHYGRNDLRGYDETGYVIWPFCKTGIFNNLTLNQQLLLIISCPWLDMLTSNRNISLFFSEEKRYWSRITDMLPSEHLNIIFFLLVVDTSNQNHLVKPSAEILFTKRFDFQSEECRSIYFINFRTFEWGRQRKTLT